jgi:hypothetical protein
VKLTLPSLVHKLSTLSRVEFVSLTLATRPKLLAKGKIDKTPCPYPQYGILKIARKNAMLNCDYARIVNNQREREGEAEPFVPERLWNGNGRYIDGYPPCIIEHAETGAKYLAYYPHSDTQGDTIEFEEKYLDVQTGEEIDLDELNVRQFISYNDQPKTQMTEKRICWRTVAVENIRAMKFKGTEYILKTK